MKKLRNGYVLLFFLDASLMRVANREITTANKDLSYTKGSEVECEDEKLNAKMFTNRAEAHFFPDKIRFPTPKEFTILSTYERQKLLLYPQSTVDIYRGVIFFSLSVVLA